MSDGKSCCVPSRDGPAAKPSPPTIEQARNRLPERLVQIDGGVSHVGTSSVGIQQDGEGPPRKVRLKSYKIDPYSVTNQWFAEFIQQTKYKTDAEKYGWSLVFHSLSDAPATYQVAAATPWWCKVDGADWAHPLGPGSDWADIRDHPVVHISWNDAMAFARWAGCRLPTEAEWEHAARAGNPDARFPWGSTEPTDEAPLCNIWQGKFPDLNTCVDGYLGTAPARSFDPNEFGLFNMAGNVWEWCADTFKIRSQKRAAREQNASARREGVRLLKGGSYLCHISYCYRYRIAARTGVRADSSTGHTGFRIVADVK